MTNLGLNEISILASLLMEERYGLDIIRFLKEERNKKISLGGLYTTLNRLENKKYVKSRWGDKEENRKGNRRKYYQLTGDGKKALYEIKASISPLFNPEVEFGR